MTSLLQSAGIVVFALVLILSPDWVPPIVYSIRRRIRGQ